MERRFTYGSKTGRFLLSLVIILLMMPFMAFEQENTKITLEFKNTPISKVLNAIESQCEYAFFYAAGTLNSNIQVSISVKNKNLDKVLEELFMPLNLDFQIKNKAIILKKNKPNNLSLETNSLLDSIPEISVKGKVVDASGIPMTGVTVSVKNIAKHAITDEAGNFALTQIKANSTLIFSSIGYESQEIKIRNNLVINISMKERILDLQKVEVVSTGYQEIPRERATGSFTQIDNQTFNRKVSNNVLDRLNDVVPGLTYSYGFSDPLKNYQIRGASTINAETRPLLVVDNFIFEGDIRQINPNDVESITILKDAAAASIWGVRAGNGVIVINLKKGKNITKPKIVFNTNATIRKKPDYNSLPSIPSSDIVDLEISRFEAGYYNYALRDQFFFSPVSLVVETLNKQKKGEITKEAAEQIIQKYRNSDTKSQIEKYLIQSQVDQQYSININGGAKQYQYFSSIGYDRSRNHDINTWNDRISIRTVNTWAPLTGLTITGEINFANGKSRSTNNLRSEGVSSILNSPYHILKDKNSNSLPIPKNYRIQYVDTISQIGLLDWHYYPLSETEFGNISNTTTDYRIIGSVSYNFLKTFKASIQYQYQKSRGEETTIKSTKLFQTRDLINKFANEEPSSANLIYPYPLGAQYNSAYSSISSWNFRSSIEYNKTFSDQTINSIIGIESREVKSNRYVSPTQFGFNEATQTFQNVQLGKWHVRPHGFEEDILPQTPLLQGNVTRFGSIFMNSGYNYADKYTASLSARIDQSNFFGVKTNDRIVPLWSAGIAWDITNETFFSSKWINLAKIRATFGFSGNVTPGVSPFATAQYFSADGILNLPYAQIVTPPNPVLKWEKIRQTNVALDFRIIKNKLSGTFEYYKKIGLDLISDIAAPPSSGFNTYRGNGASLLTTGFDLRLALTNHFNNITFSNTVIVSYNKNKVTSYQLPLPKDWQSPDAYNSIPVVGKPLDKIYTYNWAGLDSQDGDALLFINQKAEKSNQYTTAVFEDYIFSGRTTPKLFGSFRNDLQIKNFSISIGINFKFGYVFLRDSFNGTIDKNNTFQHKDYLNTWKKTGDEKTTNVPGFQDYYQDSRYVIYSNSNLLIEKADHIRLQDIKLSYAVPIKSKSISAIDIYSYLDNIGIIWKQSKYNIDSRGSLYLPSPFPFSMSFGATLTF